MSSLVPEGWAETKLESVCDVLDYMRIPINSQERATRKGGYPYYGANGIQGYIDDFIFEGEHVLLAEDGGYFDQWDSRPISYLVSGKFWVNNHAHILKAKKGNETRFIHYSLVHKNILKHINGGTRAKLNQSDMRDIGLVPPPLPEQQKIAAILTSVDNVIESTQAQIDKLKDLKTGMMQELLTKGIGHSEFKDSPVGRIPVGWEVVPIEKVSIGGVSNGIYKAKSGSNSGVETVHMGDIFGNRILTNGGMTRIPLEDRELRYLLAEGDLVFGRTSLQFEGVGKCSIVGSITEPMAYESNLMRVRLEKKHIVPIFAFFYFESQMGRRQILKLARQVAATTITGKDLLASYIPLPSLGEQKQIADSVVSIDRLIEAKVTLLNQYKLSKKALMQDLLTGKVRVKVD